MSGVENPQPCAEKDAHAPVKVFNTVEFPDWVFITCACGESPISSVWLREHWTGDPEDGKAAVSAVIAAQAAAECDAPCCTACGGSGGGYDGPCFDCYGTGHPHPTRVIPPVVSGAPEVSR